jgi:hypothetical protein
MNETFTEFLAAEAADIDTIQQALRYYVSQRAEFLPPADMRVAIDAAGDREAVEETLRLLSSDAELLEQYALDVLGTAWDEPGQAELVKAAVRNAKQKLPIVETMILATVVMYGMYLLATKGVKRRKKIVRKKDGTFSQEIEEYETPEVWLKPFRRRKPK